jgi:hypothetical protein
VGGRPVFTGDIVSAMIVMVILTTLVTPPLLKWLLADAEPRPATRTPE